MVERAGVRIHPTAEVSPDAVIGPGTSIWNQAQVREGARIGADCIIGKNVYVDAGVVDRRPGEDPEQRQPLSTA